MKKTLLVLFSLGALYLSACKDETTDDPTPSASRRELLIAGHWQMTGGAIVPPITIEFFGQVITISDFLDLTGAEPCDKDNFMMFNADATVTNNEGATKCSPSDPQTTSGGNWALLDNDTKLRWIDESKDTFLIAIQELTSKSMKGTMAYENEGDTATTIHTVNFSFENKK